MKITSILERLSPTERKALARWYDTDAWKAFTHLIEMERVAIAKDHVDKMDILEIRHLSGQASGLKKLVLTLAKNYRDTDTK